MSRRSSHPTAGEASRTDHRIRLDPSHPCDPGLILGLFLDHGFHGWAGGHHRVRRAGRGCRRRQVPRPRIRCNLFKVSEWFLGAVLSRVSNSLGRRSLWQSPMLWSASGSRSVWSAAVYRRFPRTVLCAFPFQSGAEAHPPSRGRGTSRYRTRSCRGSLHARSASQPP